VKQWGREAGFDAVAVAGIDLAREEAHLLDWLGAAGTARWIIWHATAPAARGRRNWCPAPRA